MNQNRYIPPHRRRGFRGLADQQPPPARRHFAKQEVVVTLKSKTKCAGEHPP